MLRTPCTAFKLILLLLIMSLPVSANDTSTSNIKDSYMVALESDDFVTRTLFEAISKQFDVDIHYKKYPSFENVLDAVIEGDSDFAANMTHTLARSLVLDYSSPTNIEYTYYFSPSIDFEHARRIGIPKDSIYLDLLKSYQPSLEIIEYYGFKQASDWLKSGHVDGAVDAINVLSPMLERGFNSHLLNSDLPIKPVSLVSTKGKHSQALELFASFVQTESVQRHLRQSVEQYQLQARHRALLEQVANSGLENDKVVQIKLENAYPFASYNQLGNPTGLSADVVFEACELLKLNCELVSDSAETWDSMYQDLIDQNIDILAPLTISEPRKKIAHFSSPHFFPQAVIVKRINYKPNVYNNVSELVVERIGVIQDDFFHELLSFLLPNKKLALYPGQNELMSALVDGKVDYIATDRSTLNNYLVNDPMLGVDEDEYIGSFYQSEIAIGFAKNQRGLILATLFNDALEIIDTQRINDIYAKPPHWRTNLAQQQSDALRFQVTLIVSLVVALAAAWYLFHQGRTDNLTQLKNRRALVQRYRNGIQNSQSLLYLDLNKFKEINDLYGHDVGDQVLLKYAQLIRQNCSGDCYRIGGDEFIVVTSVGIAKLNRTIASLESFSFKLRGFKTQLQLSASIGVYQANQKPLKLADILSITDMAMYQAKRDHRTDVVFVSNQLANTLKQSLDFRTALESAIQNAELDFHLELIFNLDTQQAIAAQCSLAWRYQNEYYDYKQLREHADILGLTTTLDEITLKKVDNFYRENHERLPSTLNFQFWIRLSQHSISNNENIIKLVQSLPVARDRIAFLIDERFFNRKRLCIGIKHFKRLDIQLIVDEFGAKNASFYALNQAGIERCKTAPIVAQQEFEARSEAKDLTFKVTQVLSDLNRQIIVCGIDNAKMLAWAQQQEIIYAQGRQLSPILDAEQLVALLEQS